MAKSALRALPPCIAASTAHVTHDDSRLALLMLQMMLQMEAPQNKHTSNKTSASRHASVQRRYTDRRDKAAEAGIAARQLEP